MEYKSIPDAIQALEKLEKQYDACRFSGAIDLWREKCQRLHKYYIREIERLCVRAIRANQKSHLYFAIHINNVGRVDLTIYEPDSLTILGEVRFSEVYVKILDMNECYVEDLIKGFKELEKMNAAIKKHLIINETEPSPVNSDSDTIF